MSGSWFPGVALAVVADAIVGPDVRLFGARLDLAVGCLCLVWIRDLPGPDRVLGAWILGLWRDALSIGPFGVHALPFLLLAIALEAARSRWFIDNLPTRAAAVFVSVALASAASGILGAAAGSGAGFFSIGSRAALGAAYTTVVVLTAGELGRFGGLWVKFGLRRLRA